MWPLPGAETDFRALPHLFALALAYVLALPIGWNREHHERSAGLRTFPLVAIATCGIVQATEVILAGHPEGTARIIEGLMAWASSAAARSSRMAVRYVAPPPRPAYGPPAPPVPLWVLARTTWP
jgi:hypothetical protein